MVGGTVHRFIGRRPHSSIATTVGTRSNPIPQAPVGATAIVRAVQSINPGSMFPADCLFGQTKQADTLA